MSTSETPWGVILEGGLADRAAEATENIARALCKGEFADAASGHEARYPFSLAYGQAGISLFLSHYSRARMDPEVADGARERLESSLAALADVDMPLDLFRGIAGIGWVFSHVRDWLWEPDETDSCLQIDSILTEWAALESVPTELMHGLAGLGVYALERTPRPSASRLLEAIVANLDRQAQRVRQGVAWSLPPPAAQALRLDHERRVAAGEEIFDAQEFGRATTDRVFRLGVAHGVAGTMGMLGQMVSSPYRSDKIGLLARDSMRWMLAHRLSPGGFSCFPDLAGVSWPQHQTGWCNGDLGISLALFYTASRLHDEWAQEAALAVGRAEAARCSKDIEPQNRNNPILCHGHAGRAHLLNRFFQATGDETFRDAAISCYEQVLDLRVPGKGCGGFLVDEAGNRFEVRGFLMGSAGIGLALLAATTPGNPEWDRPLGLSPTTYL